MEQDAEAAGAASLGALSAGTEHPVEAGAACRNCGTIVAERYCTRCGQLGADFQRPIWKLVTASLSDMFALDGRIWRTLPMLMLRPGRVTRSYLDGQRARFVPPFRMFLLSSVIFFLVMFGVVSRQAWVEEFTFEFNALTPGTISLSDGSGPPPGSPEQIAQLQAALAGPALTPQARDDLETRLSAAESASVMRSLMQPDGKIDRVALNALIDAQQGAGTSPADLAALKAMSNQMATVYENQERFGSRMKEWAPRFTLLFLPVFSLLLALTYCWHRRWFLFDHLIAGLHFQTFVYVAITLLLLAGSLAPGLLAGVVPAALLAMFAYLFRMLQVVYGTGPLMAGLRASLLMIMAIFLLGVLAVMLVIVSIALT